MGPTGARQRIWPWATALTGLAVSVAGNIGHIQAIPGEPVTLADRLTAATSPLAAFAGLSVGLLVVKMTRRPASRRPRAPLMLAPPPAATVLPMRPVPTASAAAGPDARLLRDAALILQNASARGQRLSQRTLARELRGHGHHSPMIACARSRKPSGWPVMPQPEQPAPPIQAHIQGASTLPEMLAACFDAFEIIRLAASARVDEIPGLFAAFMTTAGAAVNGREAITAAPSLPPGPADIQGSALAISAGLEETMNALASLGDLLADRLSRAAVATTLAADRMACEEAARAARHVRHLMARDDDAPGFW